MHRERKQRDFDMLTARTDFLTKDNAGLQQQIAARNVEIAWLQREISGLTGCPAAAATAATSAAIVANAGGRPPRHGKPRGSGGNSSGQAPRR